MAGWTMIADWRQKIRYLWSIRIALLLAVVNGLYAAWPDLRGFVDPAVFAFGSTAMSVVLIVARVTKQPGLTPD